MLLIFIGVMAFRHATFLNISWRQRHNEENNCLRNVGQINTNNSP